MNRIILGMAIANYMLVAITAYLGLLSNPPRDVATLGNEAFRWHFPLGILTALFTMLVQCIVFTYFLGTSRWVKETAAAYRLDASFLATSQSCRTRAMVMAIVGILLVVGAVASGAGAHTGAWPRWTHQIGPAVAYLVLLFAYKVQYDAVTEHIELTDGVMSEVYRIREARGLSTARSGA